MPRPAWPPLVAWLVVLMGLVVIAAIHGQDPFEGITWARWDSAHYLSIADDGYELFRCDRLGDDPRDWCGNAAWFPLYPFAIAILTTIGIPSGGAGTGVAVFFALATLVALWRTFLRERPLVVAGGALAYAAFAPGQVFLYGVYPLSMLTFFTVLHLWFLHRERWVAAGLAGAGAAMAYPTGVLLVAVSALWLAVASRGAGVVERLRRIALASGLTAAGALAVIAFQWIQTGAWDAFFKVQEKYEHGSHDPFSRTWELIRPVFENSLLTIDQAPAVQTLLVTFVMVLCMGALGWAAWKRRLTRLDVLLGIWALAFWAFPLMQGDFSLYRRQAALVPLAVLVARLPVGAVYLVAGAVAWLTVPMTILFLSNKLM